MRTIYLFLSLIICGGLNAQENLSKSFPVKQNQQIQLYFDFPQLVQVTTWEGNEIVVEGHVEINGGENNDAFMLGHTTTGGTFRISGEVAGIKNLPHRVTVHRDGQKMIFRDKEEWNKYQKQHGRNFSNINIGPEIDIVLSVKVPKNMMTHVKSVYGMVEVRNFAGPINVEATYGGVDASIRENAVGEIVASTNFGEIYTNLDAKFGGEGYAGKDFHTLVSAKPGAGPKYALESPYGNVYIRKEK